MDVKEVLYVALATIAVMVGLQVITFFVTRMIYPPEPKVIYREVPVHIQAPPQMIQQPVFQQPQEAPLFPPQNGPALTQEKQEIQLPEYEPRKPASTSLRMDAELPAGLQETRPPGT
jgi:hypothetical protein